jgi:AcrR family transcriptional regulator
MSLHGGLGADPLGQGGAPPSASPRAFGRRRGLGIGLEARDRGGDRRRDVGIGGAGYLDALHIERLLRPPRKPLRTAVIMLHVRCCLVRRDAIIEAAIGVVGRKGYRAATVGDVIAKAGVARTTFYKHFADKHECFLAAFELVSRRVLGAVQGGCGAAESGSPPERPWTERARGGLASLVELLAAEPELARVAVVEPVVAGAETRRRQLEAIERLARLLEPPEELPANAGSMAIGAVTGLLFDEIQAGRAAELRTRLPELLFALLVPCLGPEKAAREVFAASYD